MSGDAVGSPFARPGDAAVSGTSRTPHDRDDRRVAVIASAVAVVAMALGWTLGRTANDAPSGPAAVATATTVARSAVERIEPAADPTGGTTDAPPPGPSSVPGPMVAGGRSDEVAVDDGPLIEQVDVAAPVAGQPVEVVTYGNGQLLRRLDLATGRLVTQTVRRQPFGRVRLVVGEDWVMLPPSDPELPTIVVADDGEVTESSYGATWQVAGTSDGTGLWVMTTELADGDAGTIERVPISSGDAEELALPGPPSRFDPQGGFVVDAPGGSYRVAAGGVSQITTGELIAIGRDVALAEECDPRLACAVVVIDRVSGVRRRLAVDRPLDDSNLPSIAIIGGETVSPDGGLALVRVVNPSDRSSGQPTIGVIDLTDGDISEIGPAQSIDEAVWSPDGAFVFHNRGGKLVAYEVASGEVHVVADELIAVDAFGIRPITDRS